MTGGTPSGPRWRKARVARPVRSLARSVAFYRDLLGLPRTGGFEEHEGYAGAFFALPAGTELELTTGHVDPAPGTDDDLLVLYLTTAEEVREASARVTAAGVETVPAGNPYWERWGRTLLDPDGYRVVLAAWDTTDRDSLHIELHDGPRERLRPLFELAEDSSAQLDSYLDAGRVLVAVTGTGELVGHLQLVATEEPGVAELTNMAVREDRQGRGAGGRLIDAAVDLLTSEQATLLVVATAAAGVDELRFYQRHGFRVRSVQRDAFTPETGYPPGILINGIELRDRVWLDRPITGRA
jgi:ribosomal protein S18 acetylase RimI-like enzyme